MGFVALKCPQCGEDIELDDSREFGFCQYCGTKIMQERQNIHLSGSVSVDRGSEVNNLLTRARTLLSQNRRTDAIRIYERVLEIDPINEEAMNQLHMVESVITGPNVSVSHSSGSVCKGMKINYSIDGRKIGSFEFGSSAQIVVPIGQHQLTFWHTMYKKNVVDVNIQDCYTKLSISLQTKMGGKMLVNVSQMMV